MCDQVSARFPAANRWEQILANRQQSIPKSLKRKSAATIDLKRGTSKCKFGGARQNAFFEVR